jgi:hydroxysqualene synthase
MGSALSAAVEAPSGKDAAYENFPVGSLLLPAALRPHVAVFYAYARAIDDIADSADLEPAVKVARLEGFAKALRGEVNEESVYAKAHAMRRCLQQTGVAPRHCLDLISAFQQDAVKGRYADWAELIDYCDRSAAPVGRFLLDLHGGHRQGYAASDALCNALQVINHLQDCAEDHRVLDRVYLPGDWLTEEGATVTDLQRPSLTPGLRRVLDRCLDGVDALLVQAAALPGGLHSRRLAMESAAIIAIARRLSARLRREDPLARRVALGKPAFLWCCVRGAASSIL